MTNDSIYTVKQLAALSGVSPRTLHYYDSLGLLRPRRNPGNGYRLYSRQELLRLQHILFLRELGLTLEEIQAVLDRPDYELAAALENHWLALQERQERLATLIQTVERTILHLKGLRTMPDHELFAGFSAEQEAAYAQEAEERWGDTYRQSQKLWTSYSPEKKKQIMTEASAIYKDMIASMPAGPASPQAQACVARWHQNLRYFYEPSPEMLRGLSQMYSADPRFAATFAKMHPDLAVFIGQAVEVYLQNLSN